MAHKLVHVTGHQFDCLPGHIQICEKGKGSNLRVALMRAVSHMVSSRELYKKRPGNFTITVQVSTIS